eukprot:1203080-Pleurochrysis_carterae.AAC.4
MPRTHTQKLLRYCNVVRPYLQRGTTTTSPPLSACRLILLLRRCPHLAVATPPHLPHFLARRHVRPSAARPRLQPRRFRLGRYAHDASFVRRASRSRRDARARRALVDHRPDVLDQRRARDSLYDGLRLVAL